MAAPVIVGLGYFLLFSIVDVWAGVYFLVGGLGWCAIMIGFVWLVTNVGTFLCNPKEYRLWKKGGGDPFFDTQTGFINTDPDEVKYQELYRERERMKTEQKVRTLHLEKYFEDVCDSSNPDPSDKGIEDPNFL
jgi:hypothetical protein